MLQALVVPQIRRRKIAPHATRLARSCHAHVRRCATLPHPAWCRVTTSSIQRCGACGHRPDRRRRRCHFRQPAWGDGASAGRQGARSRSVARSVQRSFPDCRRLGHSPAMRMRMGGPCLHWPRPASIVNPINAVVNDVLAGAETKQLLDRAARRRLAAYGHAAQGDRELPQHGTNATATWHRRRE